MRRDTAALPTAGTPARPRTGEPWAFALNETAASDDVEITLLTLTVVDDFVRISGLVRVRHRPDVRLANVPTLSVSTLDGPQLTPVGAHALPHGRVVWVSWLYERPARILAAYEATIERVDVPYRAVGRPHESLAGPWVFHFRLPARSRVTSVVSPVD